MVAREIAMTARAIPAAERKLRISYLFPQFPVRTQVFAVSDILALRAQGHAVAVHTMKPARRDEHHLLRLCEVPADLPIMRPTIRGMFSWPALLWRYRREAIMLAAKALKASPSAPATALLALLCIPRVLEVVNEANTLGSDVVHVFWARHMGMALLAMPRAGRPVLRSAFVGAYDLVADDFLVDLTLDSADVAFSHAETNRAYAESKVRSGVPVEVIRRGIPLPQLDPNRPRDRNRWTTASALVRSKNVEAVLRLFAAARIERPELKLSIFGDGPDRERLQRLAVHLKCASCVEFAGHVSRSELFGQMQASETFLLLSNKPSERLPNVLKEALWSGCSVVASRSEGIEELIPDSGVGLVVDSDDVPTSLQLIKSLFEESEGAAAARRERARRHIQDHFSSEGSMALYVKAWSRRLDESPFLGPVEGVAQSRFAPRATQPA